MHTFFTDESKVMHMFLKKKKVIENYLGHNSVCVLFLKICIYSLIFMFVKE